MDDLATTPDATTGADNATSVPPVLAAYGLRKDFPANGGQRTVLDNITVEARTGEIVCIVGPSGAGKTTLLRCLAQLMPPTAGEIHLDGKRITSPPPEIAVVFQDYSRSLMAWLPVIGNVSLTLASKVKGRRARHDRAMAALDAVGLAHCAQQYPWQLSGGMQQRVAIARALAYQPEVLLMDEPFASVDAQTRFDLEDLALDIRARTNVTILLVTHDVDEAVYLSDRITVLAGSPAHVVKTVDVDLGRARDQVATRSEPRFVELRSQVLSLIRGPRPNADAENGDR